MKTYHKTVFLISVLTTIGNSALGQCPVYPANTFIPKAYFTFDQPAPNELTDCQNQVNTQIVPFSYPTNISVQSTGGKVGSYMHMVPGSTFYQAIFQQPFYSYNQQSNSYTLSNYAREFTVEFGFRINSPSFSSFDFVIHNATLLRITEDDILFQVGTDNGNNYPAYYTAQSSFIGNGKLATTYFADQNWHHIICTFNGNQGVMRIWIDGEIITPLENNDPGLIGRYPFEQASGSSLYDVPSILHTSAPTNGIDIDEVVFFEQDLPADLLFQHYLNFSQNQQHYDHTWNPLITANPPVDPTSPNYDLLDFVPNHPFINGIPGILDALTVNGLAINSNSPIPPTVLAQLQNFQLARYKKQNGLHRNINWMNNEYLGRTNNIKDPQNDIAIQDELYKNWYYMFNLNPNACFASSYQDQLNDYANNHPLQEYSILTNINFLTPNNDIQPDLIPANSCNPSYVNGFSPNVNSENYFKHLGTLMGKNINNNIINDQLTPLTANIAYISENGHESDLTSLDNAGCPYTDPTVQALQPNNWSNTFPSYQEYYGYIRARLESAYRDEILLNSSITNLQNAKYSQYLVSSVYERQYFEDYGQWRFLQSPFVINGVNRYYSTPPFYIRSPKKWKLPNTGTEWGVSQIIQNPYSNQGGGRMSEITNHGDSLFAPFVTAGWITEHNAVRPGQWLGLLKILGVLGADYYHTCYFNVTMNGTQLFSTGTTDPVDPRLWCYQAAMPSYAQANTSRFESFLHKSAIYKHKIDHSTFHTVRKEANVDKYLIYGTQQQLSNINGNSPVTSVYTIDDPLKPDIDGLTFEIRRQGSTYYYDNSNPSNPVFYQFDKWHEATHPYYWSKDFHFEAEVFDNLSPQQYTLVTERPASAAPKDFTNYDTYIDFHPNDAAAEYNFTPRTNTTYQVWVRARKNPSSTAASESMKLVLSQAGNTQVIFDVQCIDKSSWLWYGFETCSTNPILLQNLQANTEYTLSVNSSTGSDLDVDQLIITPNLNLGLGQLVTCDIDCGSNTPLRSNRTTIPRPEFELSVIPNPTSGRFEIELKNSDFENCTIEITNIMGETVATIPVNNVTERIAYNLKESNGCYFINVIVEGDIIKTTRVIKN